MFLFYLIVKYQTQVFNSQSLLIFKAKSKTQFMYNYTGTDKDILMLLNTIYACMTQ